MPERMEKNEKSIGFAAGADAFGIVHTSLAENTTLYPKDASFCRVLRGEKKRRASRRESI